MPVTATTADAWGRGGRSGGRGGLTPRGWRTELPLLDAAIHGLTLLVGARLEADLARYAPDTQLVVLPAANRHYVQPTDFDHASRLIGEALAEAREALAAVATRGDVAA